MADEGIRLNLGAGAHPIEGYENIDRKTGGEAFPLKYADESAEEVRASHILEHFSHTNTMQVLTDWVRVLKPGGWLKVAVPNFRKLVEAYVAGDPIGGAEKMQGYIMGGQTDENDVHAAIFEEPGLRAAFEELGLVNVAPWISDQKDCAALEVSLNIQGQKPTKHRAERDAIEAEAKAKDNDGDDRPKAWRGNQRSKPGNILGQKIVGLLTHPRFGIMDNIFGSLVAFGAHSIPLQRSDGVFWCQALQNLMQNNSTEPDIVATMDYDSLFTNQDVYDMAKLMNEHHEVDALFALQMRRNCTSALLSRRDKATGEMITRFDSREMERELMECHTGHFGLTMIRTSSLKRMPLPWFWHQPGRDGSWGHEQGSIDADVYFWRKWSETGNTCYMAPRVPIGHLELGITWPSREMTPIVQNMQDYRSFGIPEGARPKGLIA